MKNALLILIIILILPGCSENDPAVEDICKLEKAKAYDGDPVLELRFFYNSKGLMTKINAYHDDNFVGEVFFNYDDLGRIIFLNLDFETIEYYVSLSYNASEIYEKHGTISTSGEIIEDVVSYVYTKNSTDQIIEIVKVENNAETSIRKYEYDINDNVIRMDGAPYHGTLIYEYDSQKNPLYKFLNLNTELIFENPLHLSSNNRTKRMDVKGNVLDTYEHEYTSAGLLKKTVEIDVYDISSTEYFYSCE